MIKVGMMIADRYEIIEKIGTGGMSDVYRAKCHKLNRFVAVKVLKQEFSENADFVSKFRVEAQAAAGLMHPNIVNVYDVGEENGFHYIVMELVEGITLKKYIEKKARLSVKEAVSIAIQVSMGIEAAHNNHIIHRDIKPQNIIISRDGKVKVTDFGIAKAATSNTITSNVMGSVHYTSPEQVRGGFSDEKSDIYSLGITLFEMLCGRVPFNGETTVAVAIKHIQEQMPSPREYVPEIPISVEQIVLKCTQKSPDRRYQYAPELIEDLKKSLISPDENFVKINDIDKIGETINVSRTISNGELAKIRQVTDQRDKYDYAIEQNTGSMKNGTGPMREQVPEYDPDDIGHGMNMDPVDEPYYEDPQAIYMDDPQGMYADEQDYYDGYQEEVIPVKTSNMGSRTSDLGKKKSSSNKSGNKKSSSNKSGTKPKSGKKGTGKKNSDDYNPKTEFFTTILVVVAAIIIGCVFLYIVGKAMGFNLLPDLGDNKEPVVTEISMINVAGVEADAAQNQLESLGLQVKKVYQSSNQVEANRIIGASEPVGAVVTTGSEIILFISSGPEGDGAMVPSVVGMSKAEAVAACEGAFKYSITMVASSSVAKDVVISQSPEGNTKAALGATIDIVVSLGSEATPVSMPSVIGKNENDAKVALEALGLVANVTKSVYSNTVSEGLVCYQGYSEGDMVNPGNTVELHISLGVEQVYYACSMQVNSPADYAGGDAQVVLKGIDGSQLFATTTSSFPVEININNIFAIDSGELYITYNVNEPQEVTDADGNVTVQNSQVSKTYGPHPITFTRM